MKVSSSTVALVVSIIAVVIDVSGRVFSLIYVPRNRRPQTALAWLLAIWLVPYVGLILFFIAGNARLPRARRKKQREINRYIEESNQGEMLDYDPPLPPWLDTIAELTRSLTGMRLTGENAATIYRSDDESLAAMVDAIGSAKRVIHCEFYIMALDETTVPFFDALEAACARGVTVRVLVDHLGSFRYPGFAGAKRRLSAMGARWHLMLPFKPLRGKISRPDLRNHRKLLVIDGDIAFTGSRNIITPSYEKRANVKRGLVWKDFMTRFEGPAVTGIDALFITDWYCETDELLVREVPEPRASRAGDLQCQVVPSGPGFPGENNLRLFNALVYAATKRVILTSPYFVPDDSMLYAITTAAQSGLDVQLFVSEVGDQFLVYHAQRSYYEALLKAGVRIWLYPSPTVLHAKHFTIDDEISVVGSSNMDMRSFTLDLEISLMVRGDSFMAGMRATEESYRAVSRELTLEEWKKRGFFARVLDDLARLTAAVQ